MSELFDLGRTDLERQLVGSGFSPGDRCGERFAISEITSANTSTGGAPPLKAGK
jgi:hypothetical protein